MTDRCCIECGRALAREIRGRPPLRCGECNRNRRRVVDRGICTCQDCGSEFKPANHTGRLPSRCDECDRAARRASNKQRQAKYRAKDPEAARARARLHNAKYVGDPEVLQRKRDRALMASHGITRDELNALLEAQSHLCAICERPHKGKGDRLHIDHCHRTGRLRALLCSNCNTLLGLAGDDPDRLEAAAAYLRSHN